MSHISACLTHPNIRFPSVSHLQVPIHSVYHAPKCIAYSSAGRSSVRVYSISKCLSYSSVWFQVSHTSTCPFIQCLMPPCVPHIQVLGVQVSECIAPPSVSHLQVYHTSKCITPPSVSHLQVYHTSKCQSVSHIRVSHIIMRIHSVSHASKCLALLSVRVSRISMCLA